MTVIRAALVPIVAAAAMTLATGCGGEGDAASTAEATPPEVTPDAAIAQCERALSANMANGFVVTRGSTDMYAKDDGGGNWTVTGTFGYHLRGDRFGADIPRSVTCSLVHEDGGWRLTAPVAVDFG